MKLINNFNNKAIFLFGPTAVGKTQLLSDFFSGLGEVVNADSVQVYKYLDVGSAKADKKTIELIPHHLIDILEPWENYNVADFIRNADESCKDIWARNKLPIISGGTAFYFKHFLYGLSQAPQSDPEIRESVALYIRDQGLDKAYDYLCIVDPVSAARINPNDAYRISRAIEVFRTCGKPLSDFALPTKPRNDMKVLTIGLCRDKIILDNRIRQRVDIMFEMGIIDEIRALLNMGATPSWQSMQGIGYHEFMDK
ncbi:MAG: tRNA (adenosine(37)-N6)-dimethylallyltransferase MiaA, partial [Sphaerochaetaceae bacterium]|nr:tRNA (adenosine(37)-N6)-dimethylallyltransferase MiaA [Sphaerochaetaceae bacterium]